MITPCATHEHQNACSENTSRFRPRPEGGNFGLAGAGILVLRRIMTRDVTTEGQWYDPDTGATGPTYPYTDSLVTAHRVLGGDRISPARADIEAEFAPLPPAPPVALGDHGHLVIAVAERSPTPSTATPSAAPCLPAPASPSPLTSRSATP